MAPDLAGFQKQFGITFRNPALLELALTHRSYLNENRQATFSNERLEFLGDSVLSLIVSTEIYHRFPNYPEGQLTSLRSALVRTTTLAEIAANLNLGSYLLISKGEDKSGGRANKSLLADSFEALTGAIYLDQGIEVTKHFLEQFLFPKISHLQIKSLLDYKSGFQEFSQNKFKISPHYDVIHEEGPDHNKTFTVAVYLHQNQVAAATGKTKQEAEQNAARVALENKVDLKV